MECNSELVQNTSGWWRRHSFVPP